MKIELDKTEYDNLIRLNQQIGYQKGYEEAGTFTPCKIGGKEDLHLMTKSMIHKTGNFCLVCQYKKENKQQNLLEEKKQEIREKIGEILFKKFPTKDPQRYKASDVYSKIMNYLESLSPKS